MRNLRNPWLRLQLWLALRLAGYSVKWVCRSCRETMTVRATRINDVLRLADRWTEMHGECGDES